MLDPSAVKRVGLCESLWHFPIAIHNIPRSFQQVASLSKKYFIWIRPLLNWYHSRISSLRSKWSQSFPRMIFIDLPDLLTFKWKNKVHQSTGDYAYKFQQQHIIHDKSLQCMPLLISLPSLKTETLSLFGYKMVQVGDQWIGVMQSGSSPCSCHCPKCSNSDGTHIWWSSHHLHSSNLQELQITLKCTSFGWMYCRRQVKAPLVFKRDLRRLLNRFAQRSNVLQEDRLC